MDYVIEGVINRIKFAREGARVERTHATPGIGSYPVGMHTFHMVTMLLILHPKASGSLIRAVVQHDIPERISGDSPHHTKIYGLINHDLQVRLEMMVNEQVFGHDAVQDLNEDEVKWLKGLDMLEFYCYCLDQMMLGNRWIRPKLTYVRDYMKRNAHRYPREIVDTFYLMEADEWEHLPDHVGAE